VLIVERVVGDGRVRFWASEVRVARREVGDEFEVDEAMLVMRIVNVVVVVCVVVCVVGGAAVSVSSLAVSSFGCLSSVVRLRTA